jgi:predicted PurR-regulated permease PerM
MPTDRQAFYGTLFSLAVLSGALYVAQRFVLPLAWAAILATATWPLYRRVRRAFGPRKVLAAFVTTFFVASIFIMPIALAIAEASRFAPSAAASIAQANLQGIAAPPWLAHLLIGKSFAEQWWATTLALPHGFAHLLTGLQAAHFNSASGMLRLFGQRVLHFLITFGFSVISLFFFFLSGAVLMRQLHAIAGQILGDARWARYAAIVPVAIRSTVNGLVLVGLGEGVLLGVGYALAGLPSPVLWASLTAGLAIIPFGALAAYLVAAAWLFVAGNLTAAIGVAVWGTLVLLVADHVVRPRIIGSATKMPFLLVLFGILGGVETFGLIGLFIGPSIMALLTTLWREAADQALP